MLLIDYLLAIPLGIILAALLILQRIQKNAIIGEIADEKNVYLKTPMKIEYQEDKVDY